MHRTIVRVWLRADNKRNVILLISDGFGPASQTMARNYYTYFNSAC